jgi:hypothetical protein
VNQGFHPGYAGRGHFTGFDGGHYGSRGRPGGRPPVHHPGFTAQRGQGSDDAREVVNAVGREEVPPWKLERMVVPTGEIKEKGSNSATSVAGAEFEWQKLCHSRAGGASATTGF